MMRLTSPRLPSVRRPDELRRRMLTGSRRVADRARDMAPPAPSLPRRRRSNRKRRAALTAVVVGTAVAATAAYLWWRRRDEQHAYLGDTAPQGPPSFQPAAPPPPTASSPDTGDSGETPGAPGPGAEDGERDEPAARVDEDAVAPPDQGAADDAPSPAAEPVLAPPVATEVPSWTSPSRRSSFKSAGGEPPVAQPASAVEAEAPRSVATPPETARVHTNGSGRAPSPAQVDVSGTAADEIAPVAGDEPSARDDLERAVEVVSQREDDPAAPAARQAPADTAKLSSESAATPVPAWAPEAAADRVNEAPAAVAPHDEVREEIAAVAPEPPSKPEPTVADERPASAWQPELSTPAPTAIPPSTPPSVEAPGWVVPPTPTEAVKEATPDAEPVRAEPRSELWSAPEQAAPAVDPIASASRTGEPTTAEPTTEASHSYADATPTDVPAVSETTPATEQSTPSRQASARHRPESPSWVWTGARRRELVRDDDAEDEAALSEVERLRPSGPPVPRSTGTGARAAKERRGPGEPPQPPSTPLTLPSNRPSLPGNGPRPPVSP